jgi:hypothetical protein
MNQDTNLEDSLEALGAALRSRPRLTDRVMDEVRRAVAEGAMPPQTTVRRPRQLFAAAAGTFAMVAAILLAVMMLFPSRSVGWAEVTQAIHAQKWIRATVRYTDGGNGTMWLSPDQQIWAFRLNDSSYFYSGRERVKYEYVPSPGDRSVTKLPLGEDSAQRVLSMNALSQGKSAVGHWLFGTEKILSQERREITEAGKTWIEFRMTLWRGDRNQAILRVDPETKLPVSLALVSPTNPKDPLTWHFDYPDHGPVDIYALGVPPETKVDDRMPSNDALKVLRAMVSSREEIGDFRLLVGEYSGYGDLGAVVWRKGDLWRVDSYSNHGNVTPAVEPPEGQDWAKWFEARLKGHEPIPIYVCDGRTVWVNSDPLPGARPRWKVSPHIGPQDLMSGEGLGSLPGCLNVKIASLLFPDLSPKRGWDFEFDPQPSDAPGCVLLKRSARLATEKPLVGHEWYYVDPAKHHAVVRAELFNLPPESPSDPIATRQRQTIRMDNFQQTKQGFWYPAVIYNTMADDDEIQPRKDHGGRPVPVGAILQVKQTIRYHFDFAADLPDSLFTVDDTRAPQN